MFFFDKYEVLIKTDENLAIPVVSKSGCTSVKKALLNAYGITEDLSFVEIHEYKILEKLTAGKILHKRFVLRRNYLNCVKGLDLLLIVRSPSARILSAYLDIKSEKNIMYSRMTIFKILKKLRLPYKIIGNEISLKKFLKIATRLPDFLSDRHFVSQKIYLPENINRFARNIEIVDLKFIHQISDRFVFLRNMKKLNSHKIEYGLTKINQVSNSKQFQRKYKWDMEHTV